MNAFQTDTVHKMLRHTIGHRTDKITELYKFPIREPIKREAAFSAFFQKRIVYPYYLWLLDAHFHSEAMLISIVPSGEGEPSNA